MSATRCRTSLGCKERLKQSISTGVKNQVKIGRHLANRQFIRTSRHSNACLSFLCTESPTTCPTDEALEGRPGLQLPLRRREKLQRLLLQRKLNMLPLCFLIPQRYSTNNHPSVKRTTTSTLLGKESCSQVQEILLGLHECGF